MNLIHNNFLISWKQVSTRQDSQLLMNTVRVEKAGGLWVGIYSGGADNDNIMRDVAEWLKTLGSLGSDV